MNGRLRVATSAAVVAYAVLGGIATVAGLVVTAAPASADVAGPVVLIGTGGLRWDDVGDDTPALTALLQSGSVGNLAVRSLRPTTCPVDGWLAVSAGRRAADAAQPDAACLPPAADIPAPGGPATVPRWPVYRHEAASASFGAEPGLLGRSLAAADVPVAAVGPGAVIALADPSGRVARAWPGLGSGAAAAPGGGADDTRLVTDVRAALSGTAGGSTGGPPRLLVVDIGAISDASTASRADQVADIDTRLGLVLGELPAGATVIVASLADSSTTTPHLQLLAARGPVPTGGQFSRSLLGSSSTRQDGLAQSTDLLPTVLTALSVPVPDEAVGSPLVPVDRGGTAASRLARVTDLDAAAQAIRPIVTWFFDGLVLAQLLLYGSATRMLRRLSDHRPPARGRLLRGLRRTAVVFASVPAATFLANLVPWWRAGLPWLALTAAVAAFTLPICLPALLGPWRDALLGPFGVVGGLTAAVLAIDVATGSNLVRSSLMGVQPVVAGRFYGLSNPGFALFATGALLLAIAVADAAVRAGRRTHAVVAVVAIGVVTTVIDGFPGLGSDFGGPPAIIPGFAVLALLVAGTRVTWQRGLAVAAVTVAVLVVLSVADWLRPASQRTHLGRFVQTAIDGGAWPVLRRKVLQNLDILFSSWLSALLPFAIAFVVLVLARPLPWGVRPLQLAYDRSPVLRAGLIALAVVLGIGFAVNDSGTAIPAVAATLAIPLLIAVSCRALELDDAQRMELAVARARRGLPRRH
jgi:hypothetical protein